MFSLLLGTTSHHASVTSLSPRDASRGPHALAPRLLADASPPPPRPPVVRASSSR